MHKDLRDHLVHKVSITQTVSKCYVRLRVMVFNATFNNISIISRRTVLLVE